MSEIVAGRIAADLERQALLASPVCQSPSTANLNDAQSPIAPPDIAGWDLAAADAVGGSSGGRFYDWYMRSDDSLALMLGNSLGQGTPASLTSQLIRGAAKSAALTHTTAEQLIRQVAEVAWTSTTGEQHAALAAVVLTERASRIDFCSAGPVGALIVRPKRPTSIAQGTAPLASDPDVLYHSAAHQVEAGDVIVLVNDSVRKAVNEQGEQLGEAVIAECVRQRLDHPAEGIAEAVLETWRDHIGDSCSGSGDALVVIARRVAS